MGDSELSEHQRGEICAILSVGGTRAVAARYVGCDPTAIRREAERDPQFKRRLRQAESSLEVAQLTSLRDLTAGTTDWRAKAWLLERRFPRRYGQRRPDVITRDQMSKVISSLISAIAAEVSDPQHRQRILRRLDQIIEQTRPRRKNVSGS